MAERELFLGVDPGGSGGLAVLAPNGDIVDVSPMPDGAHSIAEYFGEFGSRVRFALIENVHAMPGQGVTSMFKFGWNKGLLDMALVTIPHMGIQPGKWQAAFGLIRKSPIESITTKKNRHKEAAARIFPGQKMTHAIADCLLIAEFCRMEHSR